MMIIEWTKVAKCDYCSHSQSHPQLSLQKFKIKKAAWPLWFKGTDILLCKHDNLVPLATSLSHTTKTQNPFSHDNNIITTDVDEANYNFPGPNN